MTFLPILFALTLCFLVTVRDSSLREEWFGFVLLVMIVVYAVPRMA